VSFGPLQALRPKLNDEQKQQLEECFELMDADGSGAIDANELGAAFKVRQLQRACMQVCACQAP
jgi:Ca2+-binding EF-hand superfamily protein